MSPIIEAMKPSPNSDRQSCASLGELFPKNGTAFATESPTTFVSSRPTIFGSSRRPGITGKITGNFEKNANSPCHGGKGGPSNKEAEAKFHPLSYLSDKEWVVVSCGGSNQHHA